MANPVEMTTRRTWLALGVVTAIGAVLALYYWAHKPVAPAQALAYAQSLANLAVALVLVVLGGGVGRRLLRLWLGAEPIEIGAGVGSFLEVALGWGAMGLVMLLLGLVRLYYPLVLWLSTVLLLFWLRSDVLAWTAGVIQTTRSLWPAGRLGRMAVGFTVLMLGLGFLRALAPPVKWDALVYHLTLPGLYARSHGVQVSPADFSLFSGMPQLVEMLYTAAGLLRLDAQQGAIAAQLFGWCIGAVLCFGLATGAQDMGLPVWLAPAILLSSLSIALELAWAYSDLLLMLFALAMLMALRQWRRERNQGRPATRWLALAGFAAGLACGCKYTGATVALAGIALVVIEMLAGQTSPWRQRLFALVRSLAVFGLVAGAAFAPWLAKNWLFTGSPTYPLLWPAADMDALRQWFYNRPDQAEPLWEATTFLLRATFLGVQGGNEIDATLGPLLLLCCGLLAFSWRSLNRDLRRELIPWLLFVAVAYLSWVALLQYSALAHQARLFFAFLPAMALLGAAGLAAVRGLDTPALHLSLVVKAAFALVLTLSGVEALATFVSENPLPYLAGAQNAADYTAAQLGWYQPAMQRVDGLPPGSRVIFLWEARSLACASWIQCVPDVVIDRWWHARRTIGTAQQIMGQWRTDGITHVLVYDTGAHFIQTSPNNAYDPSDWTELNGLRAELQPVATFGDAYTLYALP